MKNAAQPKRKNRKETHSKLINMQKKRKKELMSRIEQPKSASQSNTVRVVDVHTLAKQAKHERYLKQVSSLLYQKTVSGLNIACSAIKTRSADRGTSLT